MQIFERTDGHGSFTSKSLIALSGSVYAIDLSQSGDYLALSRRAGHAATSLSTKVLEVYDLGSDLRLTGVPQQGGQVTVRYYPSTTTPNTTAYLLVSPQPAITPEIFSFGTLYLKRQGLTLLPMEDTDGDGIFETRLTLPANSFGTKQYLQGYTNVPRALSKNWRILTSHP